MCCVFKVKWQLAVGTVLELVIYFNSTTRISVAFIQIFNINRSFLTLLNAFHSSFLCIDPSVDLLIDMLPSSPI